MTPLVLLLAFGAAHARAAEPVVDTPDWSEPSVKRTAQLDVISALLDAGMPDKALTAAAEVRAAGGKVDARLDVLQARAMAATGLHAEARTMLEAHTRKQPRDAAGWSALGVVLADAGDAAGSVHALERAHALAPNDPAVLNNLGCARLANGNAEGAVTAFEGSLAKDPSQPRTRNNLGFALARLERDTEALEAFRAAGSEADALYNLGVACELRGDRASALAHFHAALEAEPGHPKATAALDQLLPETAP